MNNSVSLLRYSVHKPCGNLARLGKSVFLLEKIIPTMGMIINESSKILNNQIWPVDNYFSNVNLILQWNKTLWIYESKDWIEPRK